MWVSENSIIAVADGENGRVLNTLPTSFLAYCGEYNDQLKKISVYIDNVNIIDKKELDCYKLKLSDGNEIISINDSIDKLFPFFTYMNPNGGASIRNICSIIENSDEKYTRQREMIYGYHNNLSNDEYVIFDNYLNEFIDSINNLRTVDYANYKLFIRKYSRSANNGFGNFNEIAKSEFGVGISSGSNNSKFTGINNEELVELCKQYRKTHPNIFNIRKILRELSKQGYHIPKTFSPYRFGGNRDGYKTLESIVINDLPYYENYTEIDYEIIRKLNSKEKTERLNFIKRNYFDYSKSNKPSRKILKVVKIEKLKDKKIFYLLSKKIGVINKSHDDKFNNTDGVFI